MWDLQAVAHLQPGRLVATHFFNAGDAGLEEEGLDVEDV